MTKRETIKMTDINKIIKHKNSLLHNANKLAIATVTTATLSPLITNAQSEQTTNTVFPTRSISSVDHDALAYNRKMVINVDEEINTRTIWFIGNLLKSAYTHYQALKEKSAKKRQEYVKSNFFDVVAPAGNFSGKNFYCIAAINRCLHDAKELCGGELNLSNILPYSKSGSTTTECRAFIQHFKNNNYKSCISEGKIDYKRLKPGDIVFTKRNSKGNLHASLYIGKDEQGRHQFRNFNHEFIALNKPWSSTGSNSAIIIHMTEVARKSMLEELKQQKNLPQQVKEQLDNGEIILTFDAASKLRRTLRKGMPQNTISGPMLTINMSHTSDLTNTTLYSFNEAQQKAGAKKTGSEKTISPKTNYTFFSRRDQSRG